MSTSKTSGLSKITRDKNQRILLELVSQPGNDVCADCKAKAPRWASHNLGIFICVHCASIHRKIGTHITKVKSLTLDDWTKEQVENMKTIGNIKANQYWNPDERKHPLPTNMEESERDSELEKYIRSKYEFQRFRSLSARAAEKLGPSQSLQSRTALPFSQSTSTQLTYLPKRSQTAPIRSDPPTGGQTTHTQQPPLPSASSFGTRSFSSGSAAANFGPNVSLPPRRSSFNPFPANSTASPSNFAPTSTQASSAPSAPPPSQQASLTSSTFNDLISIQTPSLNSSLPLQYAQSRFQQSTPQTFQTPMMTGLGQSPISTFGASPFGNSGASPTTNPYANLSAGGPFSSPSPGSNTRSGALPFSNSPLGVMPTGTPSVFQQPQPQASFNPFTPMQMQAQAQQQQYPGTPLASNPSPSPFFTQVQTQQTSFQPGGVFQSPTNSNVPMTTQAQQAQQIFQGMAAGGGAGSHNPFAQWGGT
ncbi:hypothetical protein ACEPAG_2097 [Sanghuangporus baumii]